MTIHYHIKYQIYEMLVKMSKLIYSLSKIKYRFR